MRLMTRRPTNNYYTATASNPYRRRPGRPPPGQAIYPQGQRPCESNSIAALPGGYYYSSLLNRFPVSQLLVSLRRTLQNQSVVGDGEEEEVLVHEYYFCQFTRNNEKMRLAVYIARTRVKEEEKGRRRRDFPRCYVKYKEKE